MRTRAFLVAAVLLVGGACANGDGLQGVSGDPARGQQPAAGEPAAKVAPRIPPPGATPTGAPPAIPPMGALPPDTVSLEELHSQGRTHVKR